MKTEKRSSRNNKKGILFSILDLAYFFLNVKDAREEIEVDKL